MKTTPSRRLPIALLVLCALAMNVLFAGLQHGQATALALSGLDGGFCASGATLATVSNKPLDPAGGGHGVHCISCLAASGLPVTGWSMAVAVVPVPPRDTLPAAPSPLSDWWPSANPRASPGLS
ncbi:DUF2946 family protein [Pseudomonas sp. Marseille-QA0892]